MHIYLKVGFYVLLLLLFYVTVAYFTLSEITTEVVLRPFVESIVLTSDSYTIIIDTKLGVVPRIEIKKLLVFPTEL